MRPSSRSCHRAGAVSGHHPVSRQHGWNRVEPRVAIHRYRQRKGDGAALRVHVGNELPHQRSHVHYAQLALGDVASQFGDCADVGEQANAKKASSDISKYCRIQLWDLDVR